ncbi:MAG: NAD(P)-dependent oxidoreductase [Candidatus Eisenbacteria bacterium]|nr:NAD(P)-dependent oxidoreductase [Candidatus Eisenbacteria bacterium]
MNGPPPDLSREPVGFLGLGMMGFRMASRLLDQGVPLVVYNRTPEKAEPLLERGAKLARTPREAAVGCTVTISMVFDGDAVQDLLAGDGAGTGLLEALEPGRIHVDMSTVGPIASRAIAGTVQATGASFLDVPVLGSLLPAERGELLLMAGGDPKDLDRVRPILDLLGRRVFHCGPAGQGNALKIVANMMLARMAEAIGEALALGTRQGLSGATVLDLLDAGSLASPMWQKGRVVLYGDPPVHFPVDSMRKDLRLVTEAAEDLDLELPVHEAVRSLYERVGEESEAGDRDYSWVARWLLLRRTVPDPPGPPRPPTLPPLG